jgi:GTP cyclohydrolase IA
MVQSNTMSDLEDAAYPELIQAYKNLYANEHIISGLNPEHVRDTPNRIYKTIFELFSGCYEDPQEVLKPVFEETAYDELIYILDIPFVSVCCHHALPFFGKAHFGYLPAGKIVGLSKVPRLVNVYARRPQVQEKLTNEIVQMFQSVIEPKGCGLVMESYHLCMMVRGVESSPTFTKTTALRGVFKHDTTKAEFLSGVRRTTEKIWP